MNEEHDLDEGPLERLWFESDVRRKLQIARDVGRAIARQSPEVADHEVEAYYRGYTKAIDVVWRMLLGR
ncbi:MAG TPA: hypothetical protein EYP55_01500 [Anaerolineae bacterium]|nr:hypothetical protein [Anaerolineae bacterium]